MVFGCVLVLNVLSTLVVCLFHVILLFIATVRSHKLKEQIRGRKHFETFLHDVAMIGCKRHREYTVPAGSV